MTRPQNIRSKVPFLALFCFSLGTTFLQGPSQQVMLGIFMVLVAILTSSDYLLVHPKPPEMTLYTLWALWGGLGFFFAASSSAFWETYEVVLQMVVMVWAGYMLMRRCRGIEAVLLGIIAGGLLQVSSMLANPAFAEAVRNEARFSGMVKNANSFGFLMVWASAAALYYWKNNFSKEKNFVVKLLILAFVPICLYGGILSGSKKTAVAIIALVGGWIWIIQRPKNTFGMVKLAVLLGAAGIGLYAGIDWVMENTLMGTRFEVIMERGEGSVVGAVQTDIRYVMYIDGLKMFWEHPFFGVGIGNFKVHFFANLYSHSNYIEPLATTGLPGFILYMSIFILPLLRLRQHTKRQRDPLLAYRLRCLQLIWLLIMILGLGSPWHTGKPVFMLLAAMSALSWMLEQDNNSRLQRRTAENFFQ